MSNKNRIKCIDIAKKNESSYAAGMHWQEIIFVMFPSLLVIIDPLGGAAAFMTLTSHKTVEEQRKIARKACISAWITMIIFALAGHLIFTMFSITLGAFRIAGGILFFSVAWHLLHSEPNRLKNTEEEMDEGGHGEDVSIVPLAIPILAGPGTITTVLVLSGGTSHLMQTGLVVACGAVALLICFILFMFSGKIFETLKVTGVRVANRIMGLILSVLAVQFIVDGIRDVLPRILSGLN